VANVLRALGLSREVTEDQVARRIRLKASTTDADPADGTTEGQILKALAAYRLRAEEVLLHQGHAALCALRGHLVVGRPAVLCVDNNTHWLAAIGALGERFLVADPADPEVVVSYSPDELETRWKFAGDPPAYHAMVVHRTARRRK
jgi:hypothetical protein